MMIGFLSGKVSHINLEDNSVIINIQGVGYVVYTTSHTIEKMRVNDEVGLHIYMSVKETSISLYGFDTIDEKTLFEMLTTVSGVGPKSALMILSISDIKTIKSAIAHDKVSMLTRVSGIGKKIAQKIIMELKDKIDDAPLSRECSDENEEVIEALEAMGYSSKQAQRAVMKLSQNTKGLNAKIAEALRNIN